MKRNEGQAPVHPARRPSVRQRQYPPGHRPEQDHQGHHCPREEHGRLPALPMYPAGIPTASHRAEGPGHQPATRTKPHLRAGAAPDLPGIRNELHRRSRASQFKRLGVIGDFENPYITLQSPSLRPRQIEVFGEMAKKGYIYKRPEACVLVPRLPAPLWRRPRSSTARTPATPFM